MSDDLIKRLENGLPMMKTVMGGHTLDLDTAHVERMEAATALAEAQAEIARLEDALSDVVFQRDCEAEDKRRAERDAAEWQRKAEQLHDQIGDWIVRADEANARADRMEKALITWRNAFETVRNEPLQIAYEAGNEALGVPLEQRTREAAIMRAALSPVATDQGEG